MVDALGSRQLAALLPDPAGARPAYRHLAQAISALILDGRISLHTRLPAERDLATALRTSRTTVTAVYDLLREGGYARSRQGAGTWTALPEGRAPNGVRRLLTAAEDTAIDLRESPRPPSRRERSPTPSHGSPRGSPTMREPPATTRTACPTCARPSPNASRAGVCPPCRNRSW